MKKLKTIKKKISKKDRKVPVYGPSKLLNEFFNGFVMKFNEGLIHES